jgi:hypothetical protein
LIEITFIPCPFADFRFRLPLRCAVTVCLFRYLVAGALAGLIGAGYSFRPASKAHLRGAEFLIIGRCFPACHLVPDRYLSVRTASRTASRFQKRSLLRNQRAMKLPFDYINSVMLFPRFEGVCYMRPCVFDA